MITTKFQRVLSIHEALVVLKIFVFMDLGLKKSEHQ